MKDEDRLRIEGYDTEIRKCEEAVRQYRESEDAYLAVHPEIGKDIGRSNLAANFLFAAALIADFFLLAILLPAGVFFLAGIILVRVLFAQKFKASYIERHISRELLVRKRQSEEKGRFAAQLRHEKEKFIRSLQ